MTSRIESASIRAAALVLTLWCALPASSIELTQPDLFHADTVAVIPNGLRVISLAFSGQGHPSYPEFLYITAASGTTPNAGLIYTLSEDGTLSQLGSATHDDLRLAFGAGVFGDLLYGVDPSWPSSYADGVYTILPNGAPNLFSPLGGGNPNATDILFGAGSSFGDFLFVASPDDEAGGSDFDYAISKLDSSGAFAGQLVYNSNGPLCMARSTAEPFGDFIYYSVNSTGGIYRVAADGTDSLFTTMPTEDPRCLAFSPGGPFGDYLYTGSWGLVGGIQRVASDGTITQFATDVYGSDLAFDPRSGDLYVADIIRGLVLRITTQSHERRYVMKTGGNVYPYNTPATAARVIQDAIAAAVSGDSIMVAAATYASAIIIDKPVYLLGGWDAGFVARDPQANVTTIQSNGSVVSFVSIVSGSPGIEGFTITGGTGTELLLPDFGVYGGGVLINGTPALIKNNVITACGYAGTTGFSGGGGIAVWNGSVTISGNAISNCAAQSGGGIYLYQATAAITDNKISGAQPNAEFTGVKNGGGIYARQSTVTMADNVISANTGYQEGGGIYAKLSSLSTSGDSIYSNEAIISGGGICSDHSPLSIHNTYVTDNAASVMGGGIHHRAELFDMANSLVVANRTFATGGGVYADSCWGDWTNNTIDRNTSGYTGGNVLVGAAAALGVRNNIVTYGSPNGFHAVVENNITFQYNNCYGNIPGNVVTIVPDATNSSRNPVYADTAAMDYYLGVHSGSIDAGDPSGHDPDGSIADQGAFGGPGAVFAAPGYVRNLVAAAVNDTTISLGWDGLLAGATSYAVYGSETNSFLPDASVFLGSVPVPGVTFLHRPVTGCRYYRVSGANAAGHGGGYSSQASACAAGPDLIPPTVYAVYPNGKEVFRAGDTIQIKWHATDNRHVDSVSIYYSQNAGAIYNVIAHGCTADSTFNWVAPTPPSDSCLIKVVAYDPGNNTGFDTSDTLFSIVRHPTGNDNKPPQLVTTLGQNYPNPFNPSTRIAYSVAAPSHVSLRIYDAAGRLVKVLFDYSVRAGRYEATWDGKDRNGRMVGSGIYFYRLDAGSFTQTKKMALLR